MIDDGGIVIVDLNVIFVYFVKCYGDVYWLLDDLVGVVVV